MPAESRLPTSTTAGKILGIEQAAMIASTAGPSKGAASPPVVGSTAITSSGIQLRRSILLRIIVEGDQWDEHLSVLLHPRARHRDRSRHSRARP
jgi:hypothetical protein